MESILIENNQLEKDNTLMKIELDNRKKDFSEPEKMGSDNEVSLQLVVIRLACCHFNSGTF